MVKQIAIVGFILILCLPVFSQQPAVYLFDAKRLQDLRNNYLQKDVQKPLPINWLLAEADKILSLKPGSVMDKAFSPPSGNKHDYMSLAPYFWPDLTKSDSLPYIRKDGQRNPMIDRITDKKNLVDMGRNTHLLALAYQVTMNKQYALKAADYLRTWFINESTRMNPNLTYAQAVLGVNDGRGIGIIETVSLTNVVDAIGMLEQADVLSDNEKTAIKNWFDHYLNWMLTSKNGIDERHALNNHGIWYDMQVLSFSLFLGKTSFAREYAESVLKRIAVQIEPDGRQPLELERTTALGYSTFCLEAWFKAAVLASHLGIDFWHYETKDGRSLHKALDWLMPYALGQKKWEYQQIKAYTEADKMYFLLTEAAKRYKDNRYFSALSQMNPHGTELIRLLY